MTCLAVGLICVGACSASTANSGVDADADGDTGRGGQGDASDVDQSVTPGKATWPTVVLVDGLVNGSTTDTTDAGASLDLDDIRVCLFDQNGVAITPHALPDDSQMPLASYPGVRRGGAMTIGSFTYLGDVTIAVFSAGSLAADAAWVADRSAFTCTTMSCDQAGVPCVRHAKVTATLKEDVNVLAIVDGKGGGIEAVTTSFEDHVYDGTEGSLRASAVNFAGWHAGQTVGAYYGNFVDGAGTTDVAFLEPLAPNTATLPVLVTSQIATYDGLGVRFDEKSGQQVADRFGQSLDSIAFVSNPTVDPPTFYGVRRNFVFALVGDPNDPTSVAKNGGRDPQFDGRGLHITAASYTTPRPQ